MESALYTVVFDQDRLREALQRQKRPPAAALAKATTDGVFNIFTPTLDLQEITLSEDQETIFPFTRKLLSSPDFQVKGLLKGVLLADSLERAADPLTLLKCTYSALEDGGQLLVIVPRVAPKDARSYTLDKLLREIRAAWGGASSAVRFAAEYSLEDLDTSTWIVAVFEKTKGKLPIEPLVQIEARTSAEARKLTNSLQFSQVRSYLSGNIREKDVKNVCVLKLDHLGDFAMCIPAFFKLKDQFPTAKLTCVCGPWNESFADGLGIFDEIITVDYYKRDEKFGGSGQAEKALKAHILGSKLKDRSFDLAIDFRVPDDSRHILGAINASCRAGIGSVEQWPFLDIALPSMEAFVRGLHKVPQGHIVRWKADDFTARQELSSASGFTIISAESNQSHLIYGPYFKLAAGTYEATLHLEQFHSSAGDVALKLDIASWEETVFHTEIQLTQGKSGHNFSFTLYHDLERVEMRASLATAPANSFRLIFGGLTLHAMGTEPDRRLMVPGQVHISEQVILLLDLVRHRLSADIYPADLPNRLKVSRGTSERQPYVVIAPLSNSQLRDWPVEKYRELVDLIIRGTDANVVLIGANDQKIILDSIIETLEPSARKRAKNTAGASWPDTLGLIKNATAVITNNSGIAHIGSALNATVLSIYSASHQFEEWGPIGNNSFILQAKLPCAPCGFDTVRECQHGMRCMDAVNPESVLNALIKVADKRLKLKADTPIKRRAWPKIGFGA